MTDLNGSLSSQVSVSLLKRTGGSASTGKARFDAPLPSTQTPAKRRRAKYPPNLTPIPSPLWPPCLANECLRLWRPWNARNILDSRDRPTNLTPEDLIRINDTLEYAWALATRDTYGSGLLVYHVWNDVRATPEDQRAPASPVMLAAWLSSISGSYVGGTVANYFYGVRAWHILHGVAWDINQIEIEALLTAASRLSPPKSKKRLPYTVDIIISILRHLDISIPLHAAVFSCLTTTFYSVARVGEFTIRTLTAFDPAMHVKPSDVKDVRDRNNLPMKEFALPVTKSAPLIGEKVAFALQLGPSDPEAAFQNHLSVNQPPRDGPLFAYRDGNRHKALTKAKFLSIIGNTLKLAGLEPLQGHGIRVGATLEYLLRGVPFDVMKVMGRWASSAFEIYLRKHAQILAPYMQAVPAVHEEFIRYTMPRVR
ncbi:hypothetical protein B0H11DRAFT_1758079 [Mycena galericulata]|nr:hypothetical protein B0H11DRAFT_1758079 [Mycena galericulata]